MYISKVFHENVHYTARARTCKMHFLHPSSPDCCKSELDLFSMNPTQISVSESNFISINPLHSITNTDVPLEFNIPGTSDQYLDPSNVFLYVKTKLTKPDGTDLPTGDDHIVYTESNFLYTCFTQVEVYLNGTSLGASAANYPYRSYIEHLLNYSDDAKQSHLKSCGFYSFKDEAAHIDKAAKVINNTYEFYGRLNGDIFSQERLILPSVDTRIILSRSNPKFALKIKSKPTATAVCPEPVFKLLEAYLYVRKVKLSPQRHLEIENSLLNTTAKYPIKRVETKIFNFTQGLSSINIPNIVNGNLPQKVIIGIVEHEAYSGNYKKSPYKFTPFGLRGISLHVNGLPHGRDYEMLYNGDLSLCTRPFYDLIANTVSCNDSGTGLNLEEYAKNSNLYAYDLTADLSACNAYHLNILRKGTLGLSLSFGSSLQSPITVVVYLEHPQLIEIDRVRNVLLNY